MVVPRWQTTQLRIAGRSEDIMPACEKKHCGVCKEDTANTDNVFNEPKQVHTHPTSTVDTTHKGLAC